MAIYAIANGCTYNFTALKLILISGEKTEITSSQAKRLSKYDNITLLYDDTEEEISVKSQEVNVETKKYNLPNSYTRHLT